MPDLCHPKLLARGAAMLIGAVALLVNGCNSQRAEATDDAATQTEPSAVTSSPVTERAGQDAPKSAPKLAPPPLPPGAKTAALEKVGDRPFDRTFDDIRFDIQPGQPFHREMLPPAIEALAGQRIRIRGYILPTAQKRGIKQFVLVRDNQECCFGPGAALYDCILVEMQGGSSAEYSIRPVAVEGTFSIQEVRGLDGKHLAIYRVDAQSAR